MKPDLSLYRRKQLRRIVPDAILEHRLHFLDIRDPLRRIPVHDDEVRTADESDITEHDAISGKLWV